MFQEPLQQLWEECLLDLIELQLPSFHFFSQFQRWQQRLLADLLCRNLIGRHSGKRVGSLRRFRADAAKPSGRTQGVNRGRVGCGVSESGNDVELVPKRFERLEDGSA